MNATRMAGSLGVVVLGFAFGFLSRPGEISLPGIAAKPIPNPTGFPAVTPDRVSATLARALHSNDFRQLAEVGMLLRDLDEREMAELLDRLERLGSDEADNLLRRFLADWTRRDARAASDWMRPRLDRFARDPFFTNAPQRGMDLVDAWIGHAPEIALEYVREHPGTPLSDWMLIEAVRDFRGKSGVEKLAALLTFPEGKGRDRAMDSLFFSWVQSDQKAAFAGALSLPPGTQRDINLGQVLARWAERKPAEAFAQFDQSNISSRTLPLLLVANGAKSDAALTLRWLEKQDPETIGKCGAILVSSWAERDPLAAFNWALANNISLTASALSASDYAELRKGLPAYVDINSNPPFASAIQRNTEATLAWLKAVPAGPEKNAMIEMAIQFAGNQPAVHALFSELPPESSVAAARSCVYRIHDDAEAQVNFAASISAGPAREAAWHAVGTRSTEPVPLPPGPDRDAMLQGMAASNYFKPERAWEFMKQIDDPQRRLQAWDDIALSLFYPSNSFSPDHLQTWLNLPDLPEEWKQPWKIK